MLKHAILSIALLTQWGCTQNYVIKAPPAKESPTEPKKEELVEKTEPLVVSGRAQLNVDPDELDLRLTINVEDRRPKKSMGELVAMRKQLKAKLKAAGIDDAELILSKVSLSPVYKHGKYNSRLYGYKASSTLTVVLKDFAMSSKIIEIGANNGVTAISSRFRSTKLPELKKKVRKMAAEAVQDKAKQLTTHFGVPLGKLLSIQEHSSGNAHRYYQYKGNSSWNSVANLEQAQKKLDVGAIGPIRGSAQTLSMSMTAKYSLTPAKMTKSTGE